MTEVIFNEVEHTYHIGGVRWPSVTEVLEPIQLLEGIPLEYLKAAAQFGNHVHQATDLWDAGQLDEEALDPHLQPYLDGWKKFLSESGAVVLASEMLVTHPRLRYAGRLDKKILLKRHRHVLDVKSSDSVPLTVGPQTAAYREALLQQEEGISPIRFCAHLKADGTYRLHTLRDSGDFHMFVSCLNIHNFRSRHGRKSS